MFSTNLPSMQNVITYLADNNYTAPGTKYANAAYKQMPNGNGLIVHFPESEGDGFWMNVMKGHLIESQITLTDGAPVVEIIKAVEGANQ